MEHNRRVHFIGIGGVGMSAIARVLLESGVEVTGSDLHGGVTLDHLRSHGAIVYVGHDAQHVDGATEVVLSSAIAEDNVELMAARRAGLNVRHRSDVLAELMDARDGIAITGAHGKTTVTGMVAWILHHADVSPTFLIGGVIPGLGGAVAGRSRWIVAEADESDGSLTAYRPKLGVVTSIEADHLENFNHDERQLHASYTQFIGNVREGGTMFVCADEPAAEQLVRNTLEGDEVAQLTSPATGLAPGRSVVTYGFAAHADFQATKLAHDGFHTTFHVARRGEHIGQFSVAVPGRHNVHNALVAIAVALEVGVSIDDVRRWLATFKGVRRRFEVVSGNGERMIVSDYAHHPSEIRTTIDAAKQGWEKRVIAVFQPHRYSRTHRLLQEFSRSFDDADHIFITDVYAPPPEQPIAGVSGQILTELIQNRLGTERATFTPGLSDAVEAADAFAKSGDIVIVMGAGDVWQVAHELAQRDGAQPDAV